MERLDANVERFISVVAAFRGSLGLIRREAAAFVARGYLVDSTFLGPLYTELSIGLSWLDWSVQTGRVEESWELMRQGAALVRLALLHSYDEDLPWSARWRALAIEREGLIEWCEVVFQRGYFDENWNR